MIFNKIRQGYADWHLAHTIKKLGHDVIQNAILSDGMDGTVYIDNLVLMPDRTLVVSVGRYQGAVFASENIDTWTQVVGNRSYKFNNPLLKLEQDMAALRAHLPKLNISGVLVFSNGVDFPKGKPDNLISIAQAKERFGNMREQEVKVEYQDAWDKIKNKISAEG